MNKEEILNIFKSLAQSQGFYGRILENITEDQLDYLEQQNFKDPLDLILFLEG